MTYTQSAALTLLTHAPPSAVKALAEDLIPHLGTINVLINRTGLVMLPYTDTATGTQFHLGEVLVSESRVQVKSEITGYGMCIGRDLEQSMAIALIDAAFQSGIDMQRIHAFLQTQEASQQAADEHLLRQVEATRIEMETF